MHLLRLIPPSRLCYSEFSLNSSAMSFFQASCKFQGIPEVCARLYVNFGEVFSQRQSRAAKRGGFRTGGFPDLDSSFLFCPFLSFLGPSRFFRDFPDLLGDGPGIFLIRSFSLSRPIKTTYEEQSERVRDTIWTFPEKSGKHPGLETPRFSFSQAKVSHKRVFTLIR